MLLIIGFAKSSIPAIARKDSWNPILSEIYGLIQSITKAANPSKFHTCVFQLIDFPNKYNMIMSPARTTAGHAPVNPI